MCDLKKNINPFTVTTPEDMPATEAHSLFVDVFTDFPKIIDEGHTFLHGPRGSGKSMMFRYLKPDCQQIRLGCCIDKLPFYGIYIRIKNTDLHITELQRLEGKHASFILNEHFMVMHFSQIIFDALIKENCIEINNSKNVAAMNQLFNDVFLRHLGNCGFNKDVIKVFTYQNVLDCLKSMYEICEIIYSQVKSYFKRLSFHEGIIPYDGVLCGYLDFLFPLLKGIKDLPFMSNGPIFLLLDDADNLSKTQTKILNSWVFTRSSSTVSLKISTQLKYSTYYTISGDMIETPHDYSEVNISTVYTASNKDKYMDRVREITAKRLSLAKINSSPEDFFPFDEKQEAAIKKLSEELKAKWENGEGRGYRANDDVVRYARPDYIKSLAGKSKSSSTYSYSGFEQQVHLSSGIVRYFLDAAKQMYNEEVATGRQQDIIFIPPGVQNKVLREKAEEFLFDHLVKKADHPAITETDKNIRKLFNLIEGLGGLFRLCLLSSRSERKVFSFAFSNQPPDDLLEIIELGAQYGYFHQSTIGKKDSMTGGRTRLYILSRRLAPLYNLDPTGFAGYLFVEGTFLAQAMHRPDALLRRLKTAKDIDNVLMPKQLNLF